MVTLDGIQLPDLVIEDEFGFTGISSVVEHSLSGKPIIWEQKIGGKPITLKGTNRDAWIARSTLQQIHALATVVGAYYILNYESRIYSVRFRNEDVPVITATPITPRPNHDSNDYYNNLLIKLMEA